MNINSKRKLNNIARTDGRYFFKGLKLADKDILNITELGTKVITKVAQNKESKKFIAKTGTIAACVNFATPTIMLTGLNYVVQNSLQDKNISPVTALKSTIAASEKVMNGVFDIMSPPSNEMVSKNIGKIAKRGKEALER